MKKSFYFLVCGEILFHTPDGEVGQVRLNAVVTNDRDVVPSSLIGKAQQALQLNFFKMANDPNANVVNVVIMSFTNLGRMTETEFHAVPEGMKLQEVPADEKDLTNPFAERHLIAVPGEPNASLT